MRRHGVVGQIRGKGLFLGFDLVCDANTNVRFDPPIGVAIGRQALRNGLITRFDPHWIALGPALTATAEQIDEIVARLDASIAQVISG